MLAVTWLKVRARVEACLQYRAWVRGQERARLWADAKVIIVLSVDPKIDKQTWRSKCGKKKEHLDSPTDATPSGDNLSPVPIFAPRETPPSVCFAVTYAWPDL